MLLATYDRKKKSFCRFVAGIILITKYLILALAILTLFVERNSVLHFCTSYSKFQKYPSIQFLPWNLQYSPNSKPCK